VERRRGRAARAVDRHRRRAYRQGILGALAVLGATAAISLAAAGSAHAGFGFLTAWGSAGSGPGQFDAPDGVAVDDLGHVYVAERGNNRVEKFSATGRLLGSLGTGTPGNAPGQLDTPFGVAVDGLGNVYVGDTKNNRIQKFAPDGRVLAVWGHAGTGPGEFEDPRGLAIDDAGNVYVADHANDRVQKLSPTGRFLAAWGRLGTGDVQFNLPRAVAVNHAGDIYVADKLNNRIQELSPSGAFIRRWGANGGDGSAGAGAGQFRLPYGVALDGAGDVFVADRGNNRVQRFSPTGAFLAVIGTPGSAPGQIDEPYALALDCRGGLFVTDEGNNRIERFGSPGAPTPRCAPALKASTAPRGAGMVVTLRCDRPCTARVRAGARTVTRNLRARHPAHVAFGVRREVIVTARGFGGVARAVRLRVSR